MARTHCESSVLPPGSVGQSGLETEVRRQVQCAGRSVRPDGGFALVVEAGVLPSRPPCQKRTVLGETRNLPKDDGLASGLDGPSNSRRRSLSFTSSALRASASAQAMEPTTCMLLPGRPSSVCRNGRRYSRAGGCLALPCGSWS
jgi:hypothetical protein